MDQLVERTLHGLIQIRPVPTDGYRLQARQAGLKRAFLVVVPWLFAILVTEMDLDSSELRREAAQGRLERFLNLAHQPLAALNMIVRRHMNEHGDFSYFHCTSPWQAVWPVQYSTNSIVTAGAVL